MNNEVKKSRISYWDVEELAAYIAGLGDEYSDDELREKFYDKFEVEFEAFHKIVEHLLPMVTVGQTLSGKIHRGFSTNGCFLLKEEVSEDAS